MPWPPTIPPNTRANSTPELDNHPSDHNVMADALTALVDRVRANQELAYVEATVAQSNIQTATIDLTGLTMTFTLTTSRRVLLWGSVYFVKGAPDTSATAFCSLWTSANVEVQGRGNYCSAPGQCSVEVRKKITLVAGTYTYKLRASTGAGFLNTNSSATEPSIIGALDLGPA
jgi:hypothetical protein